MENKKWRYLMWTCIQGLAALLAKLLSAITVSQLLYFTENCPTVSYPLKDWRNPIQLIITSTITSHKVRQDAVNTVINGNCWLMTCLLMLDLRFTSHIKVVLNQLWYQAALMKIKIFIKNIYAEENSTKIFTFSVTVHTFTFVGFINQTSPLCI